MNRLIKKWLTAVEKAEYAQWDIEEALEAATAAKLPKKLRPAEASDIVEGALLWYPEHGQKADEDCDALPYWKMVEYVSYPNDDYKGYTANCGCRYGLAGAFVEIE